MSFVAGSETRLTGNREYVRVGLTAAFPPADILASHTPYLHEVSLF